MNTTRETPAATKRHRWQKEDEVQRGKQCQDCGLRADRYGNGLNSYTVFSIEDGIIGDTSRGDRTPPCQPERSTS